jgi:hypothetical protein
MKERRTHSGQKFAPVGTEKSICHGIDPDIFRWICPAAKGTSARLRDGHFFAAEGRAHVISPPQRSGV